MARIDFSTVTTGLGRVPTRPVVRRDLSAFATALDKIDTNSKAAIEKRSAIDLALSQIELNPSEDEWKYNYAKRIRDSIDAYARYGDYSQALNAATMAASTAVSSPELVGRVRAQQSYKNFVEQTNKRTDIDQDTKDWALAQPQNQYHYSDIYDNSYNIVGGSEWKAGRTPVATPDLTQALKLVKDWTAADRGGNVEVAYVDANGNITSDISQGVYGMAYKKGGTWERVPVSKLREAWDAVLNSTPGLRAGLQQDYDVALWKYNKMTPEEKAMNLDSNIADADGRIYSPEQYLENRVSPAFKAMSYNNYMPSMDVGDGMAKFYAARATGGGYDASIGPDYYDDMTSIGVPIEQDLSGLVSTAYANLNGSLTDAQSLWPNLSKTKQFANLAAAHKYDELADLLEKNITSNDPAIREQARLTINTIRDLGETYNSFTKGLDPRLKYGFEFNAAIETGSPLPQNNPFTKLYNARINSAFRLNTDNPSKYLGYVPEDDSAFEAIGTALGISDVNKSSNWAAKGFILDDYNGHKVIKFDKDNPYISDLMTSVVDSRSMLGHIWGSAIRGSSGFLRYGYDGKIQNKRATLDPLQNAIAGLFKSEPEIDYSLEGIYSGDDAGIEGTAGDLSYLSATDSPGFDWTNDYVNINGIKVNSNPVQYARSISRNILTGKNALMSVDEQTHFEGTFRDMDVERRLSQGQISSDEATRLHRLYKDNDAKALLSQGIISYKVYANDKNGGGSAKEVTNQEKKEEINIALLNAQEQDRLKTFAHYNYQTGTYGTEFQIYPHKDKEGKLTGTPRTIYVAGLGNSQAARKFASNTNTRTRVKLNNAEILGQPITLIDGTRITNINHSGATLVYSDGSTKNISYNDAFRQLNANISIEEARAALLNGRINAQNFGAVVDNIVYELGITSSDPEYNGYRLYIANQISNINN